MDIIYDWIRNIVIYMILNTIVMNLLGNSSYKKYVSIVSGMILVIIVISPLLHLMKLDEKFDFYLQANDYNAEASDFKTNLQNMEEKQSDEIFKEYSAKIQKQVNSILMSENIKLKTFHLKIDRSTGSDTFGEIINMDITAVYNSEAETSAKKHSAPKIEIDKIDIGQEQDNTAVDIPSPLEISIKNKLSDFYNIKPSNINISIQGG